MARHSITKYQVIFYGSKDGYQDCRAQINLHSETGAAGSVRFFEAGKIQPDDSEVNDGITMNLPIAMLLSILDVLRNEKPINFYLMGKNAFLTTETELVGILDR